MIEKVSLIAQLITFISLVIGFILTIRSQNISFRVQARSANRQDWINQLRDQISGLIGARLGARAASNLVSKAMEKDAKAEKEDVNSWLDGYFNQAFESVLNARTLEHKIKLMLDPLDENHKMLEALVSVYAIGNQDDSEELDTRTKIVNFSRIILQEEWEKVKQGQ